MIGEQNPVDVGGIERLLQESGRPGFARARGERFVWCRGHHHDLHARILPLELRQHLESVQSRHMVVEEDKIELAELDLLERVDAVVGFGDIEREAATAENLAHDAAHGGRIVDHQDTAGNLQAGAAFDQRLGVRNLGGLDRDRSDAGGGGIERGAAGRHDQNDRWRIAGRADGSEDLFRVPVRHGGVEQNDIDFTFVERGTRRSSRDHMAEKSGIAANAAPWRNSSPSGSNADAEYPHRNDFPTMRIAPNATLARQSPLDARDYTLRVLTREGTPETELPRGTCLEGAFGAPYVFRQHLAGTGHESSASPRSRRGQGRRRRCPQVPQRARDRRYGQGDPRKPLLCGFAHAAGQDHRRFHRGRGPRWRLRARLPASAGAGAGRAAGLLQAAGQGHDRESIRNPRRDGDLERRCGRHPSPSPASHNGAGSCHPDPRLPELGWRCICPPHPGGPAGAAEAAGAELVDAAAYEMHRIALGVPEGGLDFTYGDTFPHEADMDQLGGVDFQKGCFVGQEVVSRMEHRGSARTRVVPVTLGGAAPATGSAVTAAGKTGRRDGFGGRRPRARDPAPRPGR